MPADAATAGVGFGGFAVAVAAAVVAAAVTMLVKRLPNPQAGESSASALFLTERSMQALGDQSPAVAADAPGPAAAAGDTSPVMLPLVSWTNCFNERRR